MSRVIRESAVDYEAIELNVLPDDAMDAHAHVERAEKALSGLTDVKHPTAKHEVLRALALVKDVLGDVLGL